MFPSRMFANRMFAPRYYPKVGLTAVIISGPFCVDGTAAFRPGAVLSAAYSIGSQYKASFRPGAVLTDAGCDRGNA